ncbi:amidohydrolase family protein [candidate division KSB1 bacterium]
MLVDINANVGHWPFKKLKYNTCSTLLKRMNKFGVDISVISNLNGIFYKNVQSANEELYEEISSNRKYASRFVPFAIINPIYAGWENDLEVCSKKFGMKGVRLYPMYHDYEITDPKCIAMVKMARDIGLPVAFTIRIVDSRQRSWMDLSVEWKWNDVVPIIKEVPDAKYIVLNIANKGRLKEEETELLKNTDIVFDTSGRASGVPGLIKQFGAEKVAFGTHAPILDYLTGLLRVESLKDDEADEKQMELIRSGNAKRIIGI